MMGHSHDHDQVSMTQIGPAQSPPEGLVRERAVKKSAPHFLGPIIPACCVSAREGTLGITIPHGA